MTSATPISAVEQLAPERDDLVTQVRAIEIVDTPSYERAGEFLKGIKALLKKIEESCGPVKKKTHEAWKAAVKQENDHKAPLLEAERLLKGRIGDYHAELERKRRIEEARLAEEARRKEEGARLEEAAALEAAGEIEEAEKLISDPPPPLPPPVAAVETPKVAGVFSRELWEAELIDLNKVISAAHADPKGPARQLVGFLQKEANQMARATKGQMNIPGVRFRPKRSVSASSG
jgi:hypothetical protein